SRSSGPATAGASSTPGSPPAPPPPWVRSGSPSRSASSAPPAPPRPAPTSTPSAPSARSSDLARCLPKHRPEPGDARIHRGASERDELVFDLVHVQVGASQRDALEVGPVLRTTEGQFEHHQVL